MKKPIINDVSITLDHTAQMAADVHLELNHNGLRSLHRALETATDNYREVLLMEVLPVRRTATDNKKTGRMGGPVSYGEFKSLQGDLEKWLKVWRRVPPKIKEEIRFRSLVYHLGAPEPDDFEQALRELIGVCAKYVADYTPPSHGTSRARGRTTGKRELEPLREIYKALEKWWLTTLQKGWPPKFQKEYGSKGRSEAKNSAARLFLAAAVLIGKIDEGPDHTAEDCASVVEFFRKSPGQKRKKVEQARQKKHATG